MTKIIGAIERISFPKFGIKDVLAKVDTGAYTSSIHCHSIKMFKTKEGRELRFTPIDAKHQELRATEFRRLPITSSNGLTQRRYAVNTTIIVQGVKYQTRVTLAERSKMRYQVLIGRRFLRKNKLVVDVTQRNK